MNPPYISILCLIESDFNYFHTIITQFTQTLINGDKINLEERNYAVKNI